MLTIIGQGDANQNHSEVPPHTHWGGEEVEKLETSYSASGAAK